MLPAIEFGHILSGMLSETNLPTMEDKIRKLQIAVTLMPQADGIITEHFFSGGMYCRKVFRKARTVVIGKVHKADHFFICVTGRIAVSSVDGTRILEPGDVIESKSGTKRVTFAFVDSIGMTVHRTDNIDLDEIEKELIEPEEFSLFDSNNQLKSNSDEIVKKMMDKFGMVKKLEVTS